MISFCSIGGVTVEIRALEVLPLRKAQFWLLHSGDRCHLDDGLLVTTNRGPDGRHPNNRDIITVSDTGFFLVRHQDDIFVWEEG